MTAQLLWATALSAALLAGCSDNNPLGSSSGEPQKAAKLTISKTKAGGTAERRPTPSRPATEGSQDQARWSLDGWLAGELATDLNGDDVIDDADFQLFVNQRPSDGGLIPVEEPPVDPRPLPKGEVTDYATLVDNLQQLGLDPTPGGALEQPFIPVPGQSLTVDGETIQVYEFADPVAARTFAGTVSPDGHQIGTTQVSWIGMPHFYLAGRALVLYVGQHPDLPPILAELIGPSFAGPKPPVVEPGTPPNPLPERPFLYIAGNKAEAERLLGRITDPEDQDRIRAVDFARAHLVVAFRGQQNTAGFAIDIVEVVAAEKSVQVIVELTDPAPGDLVAQVITFPYDLIVVPHSDVPAAPAFWEMLTPDGEFLVGIDYPAAQSSSGSGETPDADPVEIVDSDLPIDPTDGQEEPEILDKIDIRGEIVALTSGDGLGGADQPLGTVRIEGRLDPDTNVDQAVVTVDQNTRLWLASDGEILLEIGFADLQEAQRVEVQFTGPVAESYPVQAIAGRIVVFD